MTMEEYKKIRDKFYTSCLTAPEDCDRYLRAFLDWAGTVLDRRAEEAERNAPRIVGDVIRRDGDMTVTRYYGGHHPQFALYDGDTMICLCVYKKGALNAMDYILKLKGETR